MILVPENCIICNRNTHEKQKYHTLCSRPPGGTHSGDLQPGKINDRPNIVLIISDNQGWTDCSLLGHPHIETPRIDQLAKEGLTFTRGYTSNPVCRPALASLATGLYPHQHGLLGCDPVVDFKQYPYWTDGWFIKRAEYDLPLIEDFENLPSLPDMLGEAGSAG